MFTNSAIENILVVEDDLEISVDFFGYFFNLLPLLKSDPTLWTVSAWNDNGANCSCGLLFLRARPSFTRVSLRRSSSSSERSDQSVEIRLLPRLIGRCIVIVACFVFKTHCDVLFIQDLGGP